MSALKSSNTNIYTIKNNTKKGIKTKNSNNHSKNLHKIYKQKNIYVQVHHAYQYFKNGKKKKKESIKLYTRKQTIKDETNNNK